MENKIIKFAILLLCFSTAHAGEQLMRSLTSNPHIKLINYSKDNIHVYVGFYGYESTILFENDETITQILMGVSTGWQLENLGNRLGLKPTEEHADTNVTIFTSKRVYHFKFYAREAEGINDPNIAYEVRFQYPSNDIISYNNNVGFGENNTDHHNPSDIPDISTATNLNFDYRLSGVDSIKPIRVFDDGKFTYLQFASKNAELPAIFLVDSHGNESLVNFRIRGEHLIIERVASRFTLRNGDDTVCLLNKNSKYHKKDKKRKKSIFAR